MSPRSPGQRTASLAQASSLACPHRRHCPRTEAVRKRGGPDLASAPERVTRVASTRGLRHPANGGSTMSAEDKVNNTAETAKGKVKAGAGKATGNESLQAECH